MKPKLYWYDQIVFSERIVWQTHTHVCVTILSRGGSVVGFCRRRNPRKCIECRKWTILVMHACRGHRRLRIKFGIISWDRRLRINHFQTSPPADPNDGECTCAMCWPAWNDTKLWHHVRMPNVGPHAISEPFRTPNECCVTSEWRFGDFSPAKS